MASNLSVREIGDGLPVLIIHGWQMNGAVEELDFEPVLTQLPGLRRIYVDLPGMGRTPSDGVKNLDDIYTRLLQFVESRLAKSRFIIIGSSCGGYLARALTQRYAAQVDGLLLRVPLMEPADSKRDLDVFKPLISNAQLMSSLSTGETAGLEDILIQTPEYVEAVAAKHKRAWLPAERASDNGVLDPIRADPDKYRLAGTSIDEQAKFLAPTLVLCGRQDESVGYRDTVRLLELYPRSTFVVLDRETHGLPIITSGIFDALVRDWIARVHEWRKVAKY